MKRLLISAISTIISLAAYGATTVPSSLIDWVVAPSAPSQSANYVFAAPNASSGTPTFRQLVASDIPTLAPLNAAAPTGTWAFAARPMFNGATPWDSTNLNFSAPPAIGGTTPAAGGFTTLSASSTVSGTGFSNYLAAPPAIGGTTPAAGTFTKVLGTTNTKVSTRNSSGQSIPNNTATVVTGWTNAIDTNAEFNASTGTFTAAAAGNYQVSAQLTFNGAMPVSTLLQIQLFANGSNFVSGSAVVQSATPTTNVVTLPPYIVQLSAGQTIQIKALQGSGGAIPLNASTSLNYLSIAQAP